MAHKFFESFDHPEQTEKYHGKPLIRRQVFMSKAIDLIKDFIASVIFIALLDLTIIGIIALVSRPLFDLIFGN